MTASEMTASEAGSRRERGRRLVGIGWVLTGGLLGVLALGVAPRGKALPDGVHAAQNGVVIDLCEAIDTSGSIDEDELELQITGFKAALREVLFPATQDGAVIQLALVAFGTNVQTFLELTPLTADTLATIEAAYDAILNAPDRGRTNMGGAIDRCADILLAQGNAVRRVIDLSTDGMPTTGPNAEQAATNAKNAGIEIWTLGVGSGADNDFLANRVAGCPPARPTCGAKNFPVETFQQFGDAIRQKTRVILAGPNDPPVARDDSVTTLQDTPVTVRVLENDSDPNDDPLTVVDVTQPANGTATINPDQTVTYTPNPGFTGTDTFTYTISDGLETATARVTVAVVTELNQPPIAVNDAVTTGVDTAITLDVLANDSDPNAGDVIRVTRIVRSPAYGSAEVQPDGRIRYTPNPGFLGRDSFTYEICDDGIPVLCDTATVTVEVSPGGVGVGIPLLPPLGYLLLATLFAVLLVVQLRRQVLSG